MTQLLYPPMPNFLWYVVQTKPGDEHRVESNLKRQEIEVYLPLLEVYQPFLRKIVQKIKPLFPNYLFVRLDLPNQYHGVKWTRGVSKILGTRDEPVPIANQVVQEIRDRAGEDRVIRLRGECREGDLVRITSGPLKDLVGIFQRRTSDQERVRVLLNLIGVDVPATLPVWQIKKVA